MDVKVKTIQNCFHHCKLWTADATGNEQLPEPQVNPQTIAELQNQIQSLYYRNLMSVTKLLNYGDKDVIVELVTIKTIVEEFLPVNEVYQVDSDEKDSYIEISKITNSEVLKAIDLLQIFWL